jgi:phosphoribosylformimino-5-aminoimidazole carboxamide ribotide isomerase
MLIIPAIDLLGGKVVRLRQGEESSSTVYADDPAAVAKDHESAGVKWIHVVDLDAAFGRPDVNANAVKRILGHVRVPVELGGGIRDAERIQLWLEKGISRVILGSAAVRNPDLVREAVDRHGAEAVVVGIDVRNGKVALHGWKEDSSQNYLDLAREMQYLGIRRVIVTEITADGMLTGPRLDPMIQIAKETDLFVIVSGGVGKIEDLEKIYQLKTERIEGVVVGRAIFEKRIILKDAIERFQTDNFGRTS